MSEIPVTPVTENASQDPVSEALYLDILRSLIDVDKMTFRDLAERSGIYSPAWWNLRYRGERKLDEKGKNALRLLSEEFPPHPPSVTSVTEHMIHPDAAMYLVGTMGEGEKSRRVYMVAPSVGDFQMSANGENHAWAPERTESALSPAPVDMDVDTQTKCYTRNTQKEYGKKESRPGVSVSRATVEQNDRRRELGASWKDVIEAGLRALEAQS